MEGPRSPARSNTSPAPKSRPASPSLPTVQEPGEHVDSPLRKRPRLDSGVAEDQVAAMSPEPDVPARTSSPQRTVTAPESDRPPSPQHSNLVDAANGPPPPLTPSKVTLNLRSPDTSPTQTSPNQRPLPSNGIPDDSAADPPSNRSPASTVSTEPMQVVVDGSSSSDRSPVVEIIAESEESDPFASMISDDGVLLETRLLETFPYAAEHGPSESAAMIAESVAKQPLEVEFLESVSKWIDEHWLKNVHNIRRGLYSVYLESQDFWSNLAHIYWRFLTRKLHFGNLGARMTSESLARKLERFFEPYIRLCAHVASVDIQMLQEQPLDAQDSHHLISSRHLRNLSYLFRLWNQTPLFKLLWDPFRVPAEQIQRNLAIDSLTNEPDGLIHIVDLTKIMTSSPRLASKLFHDVDFAVSAIRYLSSYLKDHCLGQIDAALYSSYGAFNHSCLDLVRNLQQLLLESPIKQNGFGPDLSFRLLECSSWILQDIAEYDHLAAWSIVQDEFGDLQDVSPREAARLVVTCLQLRVCWKFVAKGRMELRVSGVHNLSQHLVNLWRDFSPIGAKSAYPPFLIVSRWIVNQRLVEYLVSVDSHPQLIARSQDVAGFVVVTHQWTSDLTNAVWDAVDSNPDPRMIAEILEMLGKIIHLAGSSLVSAFCDRIERLQTISLTTAMHHFLDKLRGPLVDMLRARNQQNDGDLRKPLLVFIRIICDASVQLTTQSVGGFAIISGLHTLALGSLQQLSLAADDYEGRKEIYAECFEQVRRRSEQSIGRLESMQALLDTHEVKDLPWLLTGMDLLRRLSEDICSFVREARDSPPESGWLSALSPRLKLLTKLVSCGPAASLPTDVQEELWSHLVGKDAFNDSMRDLAWSFLVSIVRGCLVADPLIDRCIHEFIMKLQPSLFTRGMFDFVQEAMQYTQRANPPPQPEEDQAINIPLADLVWRIILQAPENTIEHTASILLSQYHLDTSLIQKAPPSSVAATHTALIERCITQLKRASEKSQILDMSASVLHDKISSDYIPLDGISGELYFRRTLQFMRCFIHEVRIRPAFRTTKNQTPSPALESTILDDSKGMPLTIQYQAFDPGTQKDVKELKIGSLTTIRELAELLRLKTGFAEFKAFHSGALFDMSEHANSTVETIHGKGLLLIKNSGPRNRSPASLSNPSPTSVAETALLNHIDTLYDLLDLDENLSAPLASFLLEFPPHSRVRDLVLSQEIKLDELFPQGNRTKTLYSLRCIKEHLSRQLSGGMESEHFTLKGVHVLTSALTSSHLAPSASRASGTNPDNEVLALLIECLLIFLKQRPVLQPVNTCIVNEAAIAGELFTLLDHAKSCPRSRPPLDCSKIYACLLEASLHSNQIWQAFVNQENSDQLHYWLLVENSDVGQRQAIRVSIESICANNPGPGGAINDNIIPFFWHVLESLIPKMATRPLQSQDVLVTARAVFPAHHTLCHDEAALRELLNTWTDLLFTYKHFDESPQGEKDGFVLGIAKLLSTCISHLKSFKKPTDGRRLMEILFQQYLFPPVVDEYAEESEVNSATSAPILCTETRRELYNLVLAVCEDRSSYEWLVAQVLELLQNEAREPSFWSHDISRWMRASSGYSGLRNLTNTCYMNSLLTQLFMNTKFRKFMLSVPVSETRGSQRLLNETQKLLAYMQSSTNKYADTWAFTEAIQPYDADHIDICVQMDVDEFYNLLFDRWEGQMLSAEAKQEFRSLYGGQLVTQIKSKDCEHVSETVEPFMSIQCEVRGKSTLAESLHAYVQGDAMEGDNKYKCESCGGRFVNAIKRTCIKHLPENLIFHLKRFDFDLTTLDRHKINDEFSFPEQIDMSFFGVDFLNDSSNAPAPDVFELVGVLVHNGTAESGHYYSYIRLPSAATTFHASTWAEFNDTEVCDFSQANIPDQCFGGTTVHGDMIFPKHYNAYMLFYRRVSAIQTDVDAVVVGGDRKGPCIVPAHPDLEADIRRENENLSRRFCLFEPTHAHFVRSLIAKLKDTNGGVCLPGHETEHQVCQMAVHHCSSILSRVREVPDLESTISALLRIVSNCAECSTHSLLLLADNPETAFEVLLVCPSSKARNSWVNFIITLLHSVKKLDTQAYGIDAESTEFDDSVIDGQGDEEYATVQSNESGAFYRVVQCLRTMTLHLGRYIRSWDDFFGLWAAIIKLGVTELAVLLRKDLFAELLELLHLSDLKRLSTSKFQAIHDSMLRQKRTIPRLGLIRAVHSFLIHTNPCDEPYEISEENLRLDNYSPEAQRFPLTRRESQFIYHLNAKAQYSFLNRILDGWETAVESDACVPALIVREMLQCTALETDYPPGRELMGRIGSSLASILSEYNTQYTKATLASCLVFCEACIRVQDGLPMLEEAVLSIETMKDLRREPLRNAHGAYVDFGPQGGQSYLDFLQGLCELTNARCATGHDDSPYTAYVINRAPKWAPILLMYDVRPVRASTVNLLEQLIFNKYPYHLTEQPITNDTEIGQADLVRLYANRALYEACYRSIQDAQATRLPSSFIQATVAVMTQCASFCDKLCREDSEVMQQLQMRLDRYSSDNELGPSVNLADSSRKIVSRWHDFETKLKEWGDDSEGDEAISDTEWGSSFDDLSDAVTDT